MLSVSTRGMFKASVVTKRVKIEKLKTSAAKALTGGTTDLRRQRTLKLNVSVVLSTATVADQVAQD